MKPKSAFHRWAHFPMAFEPEIVRTLIQRSRPARNPSLLDPFCGSGVAMVEAKLLGIPSVGIDANPWCVMLSRVKTSWKLNTTKLRHLADEIADTTRRRLRRARARTPKRGWFVTKPIADDPAYRYIVDSGMLRRGWMYPAPLARVIHLRQSVEKFAPPGYRDALLLALIAVAREHGSNLSNGPEVYVHRKHHRPDLLALWLDQVHSMAHDLDSVTHEQASTPSLVLEGDSRHCSALSLDHGPFSMVITSPPYPADHDYTRNLRLELAISGMVSDSASLQAIKRRMLRSHSKGIYKGDDDALHLTEADGEIIRIISDLHRKASGRTDGFSQQYPLVVGEYFGGLIRHLSTLRPLLADQATVAFVLGDQQSFLDIRIETGRLLADMVKRRPGLGFTFGEQVLVNRRWSTTKRRHLLEYAVIFSAD